MNLRKDEPVGSWMVMVSVFNQILWEFNKLKEDALADLSDHQLLLVSNERIIHT